MKNKKKKNNSLDAIKLIDVFRLCNKRGQNCFQSCIQYIIAIFRDADTWKDVEKFLVSADVFLKGTLNS